MTKPASAKCVTRVHLSQIQSDMTQQAGPTATSPEPSGRDLQALHGPRSHHHVQMENALGDLPAGEGFPAEPGDARGVPGLKQNH